MFGTLAVTRLGSTYVTTPPDHMRVVSSFLEGRTFLTI